MTELISNNIVQVTATSVFGVSVYFAWRAGGKIIILILAWVTCLGILLGGIFGLGETYIYSDFYRRAYFYYGDLVPMAINFVVLFAVTTNRMGLACIAAAALFAGGKAALVLLVVMAAILFALHWSRQPMLWRRFAGAFAVGILVYGVSISVSVMVKATPDRVLGWLADHTEALGDVSAGLRKNAAGTIHLGACPTMETCMETQIVAPLKMRYFSALGGLWMTMQGGFRSDKFPSTREKFADLMTAANPFGINDTYDLTWTDWHRIGVVQSPYPAFGAGYGPWLLALLLIVLFGIGVLAVSNLLAGERGPCAVFSVFYLVTISLNHTQSWIHSGSYGLMLVAFCAAHVVLEWTGRRGLFRPQSWVARTTPGSLRTEG